MLISMSACASEKEDSKESSESSVAATDEVTEAITEEITVEETVAEEVLETEDEQSAIEESPAEEESSVSGVDGYVYTGETYTCTFNEKWTCSEDLTNFDCTLTYTGGENEMDAATTVGIQVLPKDGEDLSLSEMAKTMLDTYSAIEEGYVVESHGEIKFNDYDAYEIVLNVTGMGVTIVMRQVIISHGDNVYVINITAEKSRYEVSVPEIDKVISTFKFID